MKLTKFAAIGLACLASVGCYNHTYTVGTGGNTKGEAAYSKWESHWFFGIIGGPEIDLKTVCPSGNATINDVHSFLNGLVSSFIGIIWAPTTVEIYCGEGAKAASVTLTPEQMRAIGKRPETQAWVRTISPSKAAELQTAARAYERNVASADTTGRF